MTPGALLIVAIVALACAFAGQAIGKPRASQGQASRLGLFLGVIGVIIIACIPKSREAEIEQAQRQYEIQAEAARRAGYPFPPQTPQGPWQQPQEWQPPNPGAWQQPGRG